MSAIGIVAGIAQGVATVLAVLHVDEGTIVAIKEFWITRASATARYTVPKPADLGLKPHSKKSVQGVEPRKILDLEPDAIDPVMNEVAEHCRTTGLPLKVGLTEGHQISLGRVPEAQLKRMTPEQRKRYEEKNEVYSNYTVSLSDKVSQFDGQDDLFHGTQDFVVQKLNELKDTNI